VALDFGEMWHIETSGWPGRALADGLDFFVARKRLGFSRAFQISG
jgi:hypothetical protein